MQKKLNDYEKEFSSNLQCGLSDVEVLKNREKYGKNVLEEKKKTPLFLKFWK